MKRDRSFLIWMRALGSWHLCSSLVPAQSKDKLCEPCDLLWLVLLRMLQNLVQPSGSNNVYSKFASFGKEIWCGFIFISLYHARNTLTTEEVWNFQNAVGLLESHSGSCWGQGVRRLPYHFRHRSERVPRSLCLAHYDCAFEMCTW